MQKALTNLELVIIERRVEQYVIRQLCICIYKPIPPRPQLAGAVSGRQLCKFTAGEIQRCEILHDLSRLQLH